MNKKILSGIIFLMLLSIAGASSVTGNFEVSCDCLVPGQAVFSLQNTSSETQTFKIISTGENKDWINLNGKWIGKETLEITLSAGETKNLYAFVKPQTCYTQPGEYEAILQFSSLSENFSQKIKVTVRPSRTLNIDINAETIELKQCEQKTLSATITNTGKSDDLIKLSAQGIPKNWVSFSMESFVLEKGMTKTTSFTVKPDCAAKTGNYDFSVIAAIENTGFSTSKQLSLKIIDTQEIIINAGALQACSDRETTAQIKIKNNGRLADSLALSILGIEWAELSEKELQLNAGEEKTVSVAFKKTSATPADYTLKIKAHSKNFEKDTENEFTVTLNDCYGVIISSVRANGSSETTPNACLEESLAYEFEVLNDKKEPIEIDASVSGINAVISPSKATINAGNKQVFSVKMDLSKESPGDKNFDFLLKSGFFSSKQNYSFKIIDCFSLQVDYDGLGGTIDVNASDSKGNKENPFTVKIKNTGTKNVNVSAVVSGPSWIYFQPDTFALAQGEQKAIYLYFDPPYDTKHGSYETELKITAEQFSDSKQTKANVYGGLYGIIGKATVSASGELDKLTQAVEKTVEIAVTITNDSNSLLKITDFNAFGYSASFDFAEKTLQPDENMPVKMTLYLGKDFKETQFTVPLRIYTDKGETVRDIQIDLNAPQKNTDIGITGLFSMGNLKDFILIGLIALVIVLAIVLIFKGTGKEEKEEKFESYWKTPEEKETGTGKSLEEISKKIKSKPKAKAKPKRKRK